MRSPKATRVSSKHFRHTLSHTQRWSGEIQSTNKLASSNIHCLPNKKTIEKAKLSQGLHIGELVFGSQEDIWVRCFPTHWTCECPRCTKGPKAHADRMAPTRAASSRACSGAAKQALKTLWPKPLLVLPDQQDWLRFYCHSILGGMGIKSNLPEFGHEKKNNRLQMIKESTKTRNLWGMFGHVWLGSLLRWETSAKVPRCGMKAKVWTTTSNCDRVRLFIAAGRDTYTPGLDSFDSLACESTITSILYCWIFEPSLPITEGFVSVLICMICFLLPFSSWFVGCLNLAFFFSVSIFPTWPPPPAPNFVVQVEVALLTSMGHSGYTDGIHGDCWSLRPQRFDEGKQITCWQRLTLQAATLLELQMTVLMELHDGTTGSSKSNISSAWKVTGATPWKWKGWFQKWPSEMHTREVGTIYFPGFETCSPHPLFLWRRYTGVFRASLFERRALCRDGFLQWRLVL